MDGEGVTVTKLVLHGERCYLLIGWQKLSFKLYLYGKENLWKGTFLPSRLSDFSKNLQMTEDAYLKSLKNCLSEKRENYHYELKNGFFYWKRKLKGSIIIEGFVPVEATSSPKGVQPNLIEVLVALNNQLNKKANLIMHKFNSIKNDYQKSLEDTEEFFNLKIEMEKALGNKFLSLLTMQKSKIEAMNLSKREAQIDHQKQNSETKSNYVPT